MQSTTAQVAVCVAELFNPTLCSATSDALRLSQEEIARLCGLSRQIANCGLHELQAAGFVQMQYGTIHVLDVEGPSAFGRGGEPGQHALRPVTVVTSPHCSPALVDRLNKIAHEADVSPSYPGERWPMGRRSDLQSC